MKEQDIKNIWKNTSQMKAIKFDMEHLLIDFKSGMEYRERIVRNRDRREIIVAFVGIVGFSILAFYLPVSVSTIGVVLTILTYINMIYKLRSNRKSKHTQELFLPIKDQLLHQKQFMLNQAKLLDTVLYWMALPLFVGIMIFFWGLEFSDSSDLLSILTSSFTSKLLYSLLVGACFAYIVWTNKKAVKVNWEPLIKQIDTILDSLKKE
ncbi:hypothetical protein [Psychroserpens algicola]|uniref:Uncharacterized protein n=1 Tax=Psychroserpens algicola TaxID=1719034 RepID=A0ABT0H942_9FLAO|nr:hypothetical protein [Psychroserpens algicola]MCK8480352.1 hypothetical protein [Psychroserpens algicola]